MSKKYLLLRNNKQTGPFTLEELAGEGFKKYDLVWVEGESAGWRSPNEVSAIQSYLTPQPIATATPTEQVSTTKPEAATNSNRHIFVSFPGAQFINKAAVTTASVITAANDITNTEDALTPEQKLERKAEALRQKAMNYKAEAAATNEDALNTKYSRSLEDIKQEYTAWMRNQQPPQEKLHRVAKPTGKDNSSNWILRGAVALGVMAIVGIGYMIVNDALSRPQQIASVRTPVSEINGTSAKESTTEIKNQLPSAQPAKKVRLKSEVKPVPRHTVAAANNPVKKTNQPLPIVKQQTNPKKETTLVVPERRSTLVTNSVTASGYSSGDAGVWTVVLNNNSGELLKMVAVDVQYKKEGGQQNTKTVYFNNVSPNATTSADVRLPKKAASVSYRIGLISSEKGGIYFARN